MFRTIIAGTAVAGALTFGAAGIAGAVDDRHREHRRDGCHQCRQGRALRQAAGHPGQGAEGGEQGHHLIPKAQAGEAKAKTAGHTKLADAIAERITKVQNRETKVNARLAKAQAECGTGGSSTG